MVIRLRFAELLRERGMNPNRLIRSGHGLSRTTVYALANAKGRVRLDLDVLAKAIEAIEVESGKPVELSDVLEFGEDVLEREPVDYDAFLANLKPRKFDDLLGPKAFTAQELEEDEAYWLSKAVEDRALSAQRDERLERVRAELDDAQGAS
jgi:hypothetical protein